MYELKILPAAQKDLDRLEARVFNRIKNKMLALKEDPRLPGSIKLSADEGYRIRIGDYRVIYRMDDSVRVIYIYRVKHRRDVYR